jgi:CheY-like chemotaxis protein
MYNVLLLDDHEIPRTNLREEFECHKITVFPCKSLNEAIDAWRKHKDELNAIVFDMMMSSSGIDRADRDKAEGGLLSGWIWLWHTLNPDGEDPHPAANKCITIYSAYLEDLDEYLNSDKPSDKEKEFANSVKRIEKDFLGEHLELVVKHVIEDRERKPVEISGGG